MNKKCLVCANSYNPQDSGSFFNFKFCSDECEQKAEIEAKSAETGVHMYMCISPFPIRFSNGTETGATEIVVEGSKWRIDGSLARGLNKFHLENLSGRVDEKITWLEVDEQALSRHFQKI
ncbi:hypothetical protein [Solibacillus sp. FSL K6-1523]|uniref:hypothetical protein n=1 Tax=Solibacillus sp. FSL K6-1523 TaxID=2921471 RepID=UPI0030FBB8E3